MTTAARQFKGFVFPGSNYVRYKHATVHVDSELLRVELKDGSTAFSSSLDDLWITHPVAFKAPAVPYVIMRGTSGFVRLGFSSMKRRNQWLAVGTLVTFILAGIAGGEFNTSPIPGLLAVASAIGFFWLAQRSIRPGEGPAFSDELLRMIPDLLTRTDAMERGLQAEASGEREKMPRPPVAVFSLLVLGFMLLITGAGLITMSASYAVWPNDSLNEGNPEGRPFRAVVVALSLVGLPLYYRHRMKIDQKSGRNPETDQLHIDWPAMLAPVGVIVSLLAIFLVRRLSGI